MKNVKLFLVFALFCFIGQLHAQTNPEEIKTQDVIYLKNGSVFKGKILEYEKGAVLLLELENGSVIEFEDDEIDRVVQEAIDLDKGKGEEKEEDKEPVRYRKVILKKKEKVYRFRETGIYNATFFSSSNGSHNGELQVGLGVHNVIGYQLNRLFGLGIGVGLDSYSFQDGETLYPIFIEARGYLRKKWHSPYYSMNLGYGFAIADESENVIEAEGGLMVHPCFGMRFGANKDANVMIDVGYKFQYANITRVMPFNGDLEERDLLFKRLTIRLGLLF